jgi:hypothetical protein
MKRSKNAVACVFGRSPAPRRSCDGFESTKRPRLDLVLLEQDRNGDIRNAAVMNIHPAGSKVVEAAVDQRKDELRAVFTAEISTYP